MRSIRAQIKRNGTSECAEKKTKMKWQEKEITKIVSETWEIFARKFAFLFARSLRINERNNNKQKKYEKKKIS